MGPARPATNARGAAMTAPIVETLKATHAEHEDAIFSLFTLAGHVVSGRITAIGATITLAAGKELAEVPADRIEAFSYRSP
jgi:hypothetical protein